MRPMRTIVSKLRRKLGDNAGQPHLHLHRASRRLPDAQGRDGRHGDVDGGVDGGGPQPLRSSTPEPHSVL